MGIAKRLFVVLALLTGPVSVHAASVLIEFETEQIVFLDGYTEAGFDFAVDQPAFVGAFGKNALLGTDGPAVSALVMTNSDSRVFDLVSFDGANLQNVFFEAVLTGEYAAGGQVQATISVDDAFFETLVFDQNDWAGLSALTIVVDNTAYPSQLLIDNLNLNVVPIPGAIWLFASALAGLGWMRRQ